MSEFILAIHVGHNASALIGTERDILYAVQEERYRGEKNYWGYPEMSIAACLDYVGKKPNEIKHIVFGANQLVTRYHSREDVLDSYARQDTFSGAMRQRFLVPFVLKVNTKFGQKEVLQKLRNQGFDTSNVVFYDHHGSHAATAYYGLRKSSEDYLVLTCDGSGDDLCATVRIMGPKKDEVVASTQWNNSLGAMYSWTTFRMGFIPLEHEYKLMGMAPYTSGKYAEEVEKIYNSFLGLDESGLMFKKKTTKRVSDVSRDLFGKLDGKRFDAICGGVQSFTENILSTWALNAIKKTGIKKILAAGGVFMNVKANKVIGEMPEVDYFEAFPSCGDETLVFGAYYTYVAQKFGDENVKGLKHFYTGDDIKEKDILLTMKNYPSYRYYKMQKPSVEVATLLSKGYPVARCTGAMEFGARALGNRSILADPSNQDVVRVINQMVKKRDFWMPFAPMMKKDQSIRYIKNDKNLDSPYMMMTFDTKDNFRELIAAVHNADLTCRAQLLTPAQNNEMYEIIDQFDKLTGKAVVLNTSFNLHGFPIARTPSEAMYIFHNSGLEFMQLGNYMISKRNE